MVSSPRMMGSHIQNRTSNAAAAAAVADGGDAIIPTLQNDVALAVGGEAPSISCDSSCSSDESSLTLSAASEFVPSHPDRNHSTGNLVYRRSRRRGAGGSDDGGGGYCHHHQSPTTPWHDNSRDSSPAHSVQSAPEHSVSSKFGGSNHAKRRRSAIRVFFLGGFFFSGISAGCYFVFHSYLSAHDEALKKSLRESEFFPVTNDMEKKLLMLEKDNTYLQDRLITSENQREALVAQAAGSLEDPRLHDKLRLSDKQKNSYRLSVQKLSQYALNERFGNGPHHVEIQLAFDFNSMSNTQPAPSNNKVVLELAPATEMPHSVFWFLEQVTRGLYDATSIHSSAPHVIQGGPSVTNFLSTTGGRANPMQRFKRCGFDSVLIQEYHENWTHAPFTIGYPGRPGGPDFYINTKDNAKIHGPGGQASSFSSQQQHQQLQDDYDPTLADPCFGKVIFGFDVVNYIHKLPVQPGSNYQLQDKVEIVYMRLLDKNDPSMSQIIEQQQQRQQQQGDVEEALSISSPRTSPRALGPPPVSSSP